MISSYAGRKVLRRLDSPRGGFNRQPGDRNWGPWPPGIGVQHLVMDDDGLRRIGSLQRRNRSDDRNLLLCRNQLLELYGDLLLLAGRD